MAARTMPPNPAWPEARCGSGRPRRLCAGQPVNRAIRPPHTICLTQAATYASRYASSASGPDPPGKPHCENAARKRTRPARHPRALARLHAKQRRCAPKTLCSTCMARRTARHAICSTIAVDRRASAGRLPARRRQVKKLNGLESVHPTKGGVWRISGVASLSQPRDILWIACRFPHPPPLDTRPAPAYKRLTNADEHSADRLPR